MTSFQMTDKLDYNGVEVIIDTCKADMRNTVYETGYWYEVNGNRTGEIYPVSTALDPVTAVHNHIKAVAQRQEVINQLMEADARMEAEARREAQEKIRQYEHSLYTREQNSRYW